MLLLKEAWWKSFVLYDNVRTIIRFREPWIYTITWRGENFCGSIYTAFVRHFVRSDSDFIKS